MKLLFDENLSPKLVKLLDNEFPDSNHRALKQNVSTIQSFEENNEEGLLILEQEKNDNG
jgi:predicted nuclease of predicted toxin-antitoxin system